MYTFLTSIPVDQLFPRGITPYLLGGLLVGLGAVIIYVGTGIITGASTFLESSLSYVSSIPRVNEPRFVESRGWRLVFTLGIISGAAVYTLQYTPGIWVTEVQWWRLLAGGILVGIGTRIGKGCTSGHGVCGVGSLSVTSFINVAIFILIAIGTAQLVQAYGITP